MITESIIIDCAAPPFAPEGYYVEEHQVGDRQYQFNLTKISLCQSKKQLKRDIEVNELRQELEGQKVLNANVLDYLLAHPDIIPAEWKGKNVFFFGTIYRRSVDSLCVRFLSWSGSRWIWQYYWLGSGFYSHCFFAVAS